MGFFKTAPLALRRQAPPTVISSNIKPPHAGLPLAGSPPPSLSPRLDIKRPMARRRAECFDSDGRQGARGSEREGGREGRGGEREGRGRYGRRAEAPLLYNRALLRHLPTLISNSQWARAGGRYTQGTSTQWPGGNRRHPVRYACFFICVVVYKTVRSQVEAWERARAVFPQVRAH